MADALVKQVGLGRCRWNRRCWRRAVATAPHRLLGPQPICRRCLQRTVRERALVRQAQ